MNYTKAYEWIGRYQEADKEIEHEKYTVAMWNESGSHAAYPHWVLVQIRAEPEEKEVA